jgi:hypothetical protein
LKYHRPQHKPESEEKKKNKLLSELKKQVQQLKRKNGRLQKAVNQRIHFQESAEDNDPVPLEIPASGPKCSACGASNITSLVLPSGKTLNVCKECKHKWN